MTNAEQQKLLIETAQELMKTLQTISRPVNDIVCKLDAASQALIPKVLAEYKDGTSQPLAKVQESKRACSICRQPGHRSTTCPMRESYGRT